MFKILSVAALGMLVAGAASATTYHFDQGLTNSGGAVSAGRSNEASINDGNLDTFYSLGMGGTISADIAPGLIETGSVVEVTYNNAANHPEFAEIYLGGSIVGGVFDDTGAILIGELANVPAGGVTETNNGGSSITRVTTAAGDTTFTIDLGTLVGSMMTIVDTSNAGGRTANANSDGFDVGEFNVFAGTTTVSTVPLPAGAWLLIGAFGGLAALRRRKS